MRRTAILGMIVLDILLAGGTTQGAQTARFARRTPVVVAVGKVGPAVVNISTEKVVVGRSDPFFAFRDRFFDEHFREFFERHARPRRYRTTSLGSGVIIDPEGYAVTNEHVIRRASRIQVTLSDGTNHEGRLLSSDPDSDLALIKIDARKPLPAIVMGRSDDLMIGETVIALGNAFGLQNTVTTGVVSAKNRSVMLGGQEAYAGLIQTDAAINPGNSGGPLVNINGELIGINVAIRAKAEGIGFAIPIDRVRDVLTGLFNYRVIKKTYIGIRVSNAATTAIGGHATAGRSGVAVTAVDGGSPAAQAGLRTGDIVTQVDKKPVRDRIAFFKSMLGKDIGQRVVLHVRRGDREHDLPVTVGHVPKPSAAALTRRKLGLSLQAMTQQLAPSFGLRRPVGLLVTGIERGGPGERAGLRRGDVIVRFGPLEINTMERLAIVLEQAGVARAWLVIVRRGRLYRANITTR